MSENGAPAEVFCLAEFLFEEMEARGWKTEDAVIRMGETDPKKIAVDLVTLDLLMVVQDDKLLVGDSMFRKLAVAFDVNEDYFRNIDSGWREHPDRRSPFKCPESVFGTTSRRALIRSVPA